MLKKTLAEDFLRLWKSPFIYASLFISTVFISLYFWTSGSVFSFSGSTDLHRFFMAFPLVSVLFLPSAASFLRWKNSSSFYECSSLDYVISKLLTLFSSFCILLLLTSFIPLYLSSLGDIDKASLFASYVGLIFFALCTISFIIMVFTTTENRGFSFALSALFLTAFTFIHSLALKAEFPLFISKILHFFSFSWHFDAEGKGIIDSKDILYFFFFSLFFIALSVFVLEKKSGRKGKIFDLNSFLICLSAFLCTLACQSFHLRFDLSAQKKFAVSSYSRALISKIQLPLEITYWRSPLLLQLYPQVNDVEDYLEEYSSFSDRIKLRIKNPSTEEEKKALSQAGLPSQSLETQNYSAEVYSGIVITYSGMTSVIPFVMGTETLEFDLSSKISALFSEKTKIVQLCAGNGMKIENDYFYVKKWLESQDWTVFETLLPSQKEASGEKTFSFADFTQIPFIILGTSDFTKDDAAILSEMIASGEKGIIASSPWKIDPSSEWNARASDDPFILKLMDHGIFLQQNMVADISNFRLELFSNQTSSGEKAADRTEYINYSLWPELLSQKNAPYGMILFWPAEIFTASEEEQKALNIELNPYLFSSDQAWTVNEEENNIDINPFTVSKSAQNEDIKGRKTLAVELKENKGDVLVISDPLFVSSLMLNYIAGENGDFRSVEFLSDSLLHVNGDDLLLETKRKPVFNTSFYKNNSSKKVLFVKSILLTIVIPFFILLSSWIIFYTVRRKRISKLSKEILLS